MEFELAGQTYRVNKIDARVQFHIVRRLATVLGELAPSLASGSKQGVESLPALTNAIARLSDADADYCLFGLIGAISRKQPQGMGWGSVSTGTTLMYEDVTMPIMLQLAWKSLQFNMSGFFAALPSDLQEAAQKASAQSNG